MMRRTERERTRETEREREKEMMHNWSSDDNRSKRGRERCSSSALLSKVPWIFSPSVCSSLAFLSPLLSLAHSNFLSLSLSFSFEKDNDGDAKDRYYEDLIIMIVLSLFSRTRWMGKKMKKKGKRRTNRERTEVQFFEGQREREEKRINESNFYWFLERLWSDSLTFRTSKTLLVYLLSDCCSLFFTLCWFHRSLLFLPFFHLSQ